MKASSHVCFFTMFIARTPREGRAIVAIPAHNEAAHIESCLAALAMQRDATGAPVPDHAFQILIFANNCSDATAETARAYAALMPQPVSVVEETMDIQNLNAGWARKRAMDLAAIRLTDAMSAEGVILTTDADSCVAPTWFSANMKELAAGADCVAGYIDGQPTEILGLGRQFLSRGRLEDAYLSMAAEIFARCDPREHDPWPSHRVSSGASLAVTLPAYTAIGGLPPRPLGEDAALTAALDRAGFKVRHSTEVCVTTSCRLDGRAQGGAADTMRHRHEFPDAPCDDDIEPAYRMTRRAICRGMLRAAWGAGRHYETLGIRYRLPASTVLDLADRSIGFEDAWSIIGRVSPLLQRGKPLRPSDLPRQIAIAGSILRTLRLKNPQTVRAGTRHQQLSNAIS